MEELDIKDRLQIELSEDVAQGVYSNFSMVAHSSSEVVLDFVRILPGVAKASVKSRVIMAPEHAKRLMLALQDNLGTYEATFGPIKLYEERGLRQNSLLKGDA